MEKFEPINQMLNSQGEFFQQLKSRIKSPYPLPDQIVKGSTPVISFGDFWQAKIFTVGLNPSKWEFLNNKEELFSEREQKLWSYPTLCAKDYHELTDEQILSVYRGCCDYFDNFPNNWFDKFSPILESINCSFKQRTAAHIDLVQWATNDKWGKLDRADRKKLLDDGESFLKYQLSVSNVEILLLNGKSVIEAFAARFNIKYKYHWIEGLGGDSARIVSGHYGEKIKVIGWSTNLQSSFGVSDAHIDDIASIVKNLVKEPFV